MSCTRSWPTRHARRSRDALIIAELSTAYPYQGGIYSWVHRAFGRHWAARAMYWYWVNVAMWMPSAYLLFTGGYTGPLLGFFGVAVMAGEVLVGWSLHKYKGEPTQLPGKPEAPSGQGEQAA